MGQSTRWAKAPSFDAMPQPELVARLDKAERAPLSGLAFRHHGGAYSPLDASGSRIHGGRWNPRESFPVLYVALDRKTAIAELTRLAKSQGLRPDDLLPRSITSVEVQLSRVLDLTRPETREDVGITEADLLNENPRACQAIGEAAHYLGFEGIRAPSATSTGEIVAIFMDKQLADSTVKPLSTKSVDRL